MSNAQKGTFKGLVTDYGIGETQGGDPQVFVAFDVDFPGGKQAMTWFGSLKGGALPITLKALLALGHTGKVADLLDGPNQDNPPIRLGIDANLVIDENEYNGKTTLRINWVNMPGGSGVKRADAGAAKAALAKLGVNGELAKLRMTEPKREESPF